MMEIYKSIDGNLDTLNHFEEGVWVNLVNPSEEEILKASEGLELEIDALKAALDEEETSRIEYEDAYTLIVVDVPFVDTDSTPSVYMTIPLGIILNNKSITTVCLRETSVTRDFIDNKVKTFFTYKKSRFILQILFKNATRFLQYLKQIDKQTNVIEAELHKSMKNKELIQLLALEKSLVYFSTSLKANESVLEKMLRAEYIRQYPEDQDLLEDVIVENKQAMEMAKIYSNILSGTMGAFASVISNNVNTVMKFLASITIVLSIPTMIASFFGMNVPMPVIISQSPFALPIIFGISFGICGVAAIFMAKRKMF